MLSMINNEYLQLLIKWNSVSFYSDKHPGWVSAAVDNVISCSLCFFIWSFSNSFWISTLPRAAPSCLFYSDLIFTLCSNVIWRFWVSNHSFVKQQIISSKKYWPFSICMWFLNYLQKQRLWHQVHFQKQNQ